MRSALPFLTKSSSVLILVEGWQTSIWLKLTNSVTGLRSSSELNAIFLYRCGLIVYIVSGPTRKVC